MKPSIRNALWFFACVLAALASAAWSAYHPWGWAPEPERVDQPICKPNNPQPGCIPLHKLT